MQKSIEFQSVHNLFCRTEILLNVVVRFFQHYLNASTMQKKSTVFKRHFIVHSAYELLFISQQSSLFAIVDSNSLLDYCFQSFHLINLFLVIYRLFVVLLFFNQCLQTESGFHMRTL